MLMETNVRFCRENPPAHFIRFKYAVQNVSRSYTGDGYVYCASAADFVKLLAYWNRDGWLFGPVYPLGGIS